MKIGLISFQFNSNSPDITRHYSAWLIEAMRRYEEQEGALPELVLSAGFTCVDPADLTMLEREFGDKPVSLAVEMLDPADNPMIGSRRLKGCGQFFVVGNGRRLELGPRQQFSSTGNINEERAEKVVAGLGPNGGRRFSAQSRQIGWLECGEMNVLRCQQDGAAKAVLVRYEALERRFFEAVTSLDIILNPQHTRMSRLHLLRRKVEALSTGVIAHAPSGSHWPIYCGTTNWDAARQHRSQHNLQSIMSNGKRQSPRDIIETENYILSVFDVDVPQRLAEAIL